MTIQDKAQHFFFDNKMTIKGTEYLYRDDFFTFVSSLEGIVEAKDASTSDGAASSKTAPAPASAKQGEGSEPNQKEDSLSKVINTKEKADKFMSDLRNLSNEKREGSESYWKKRCEAAERLVWIDGTSPNWERLINQWNELQSSIGEETKGQDELWDEVSKLLYQNGFHKPVAISRLKSLYSLIKKPTK